VSEASSLANGAAKVFAARWPGLPLLREAHQKGGEAAQRGARQRSEPREPGCRSVACDA